jgi:hypothetical protein
MNVVVRIVAGRFAMTRGLKLRFSIEFVVALVAMAFLAAFASG